MNRSDRRSARLSGTPSEPPENEVGGGLRRAALGCGVTLVVLTALSALLGLLVVVGSRFAGRDDARPSASNPDDLGSLDGPPPSPTYEDPLEEMRRRYRIGPYVRLEGIIPGERAYRAAGRVSPWTSARSADTPWVVFGASFERASAPAPSPDGAPTVLHAPDETFDRPIDLIPHVPATVRVAAMDGTGGPDVVRYLVSFEGYSGHFVLPARVFTELGPVAAGGSEGASVRFTIGSPQRPDGSFVGRGDRHTTMVRVQAVDSSGRVSQALERAVSVLPLGQGDLEVAMTMNAPTDLDLYVTDPAGTTVYYGNTHIFSGGQLDLDANANCAGNRGAQAEHVFWPPGAAPAGVYSVRVAHFRNCIEGRPVEYRVTVRACGETVVLVGRFDGPAVSSPCTGSTSPAWCHDVVSFELPSCRLAN